MDYSKRLENIRINKNLSVQDIANFLNIDRSLYAKYEKEYLIIPIKYLIKLCNFFDVSLDYLFQFEDTEKYNNMTNNFDTNIMASRIKEFRKDNKLTQIKLAAILNIGNGTIAEYEKGHFIISTHALYTICKKYNISADYLLGRIDNPKYLKNH